MSNNPNPFQPPSANAFAPQQPYAMVKPVLTTPASTRSRMDWGESLSYVFRHPNWLMTMLFGTICQFIPVVGPLVFMGYQFETVIDLTVNQGATYQAFDFNRFVPYLKRGVWPFLVALVIGLCLVPALYVLLVIGVIAIAAIASAAGEDAGPIVGLVLGGLGFLCFMALAMALNVLVQPMLLRAALTQQFGQAFQFSFVRDFVQRVGKEMLLAILYQMVVGMLITMVGMIACFVGVYPAIIIVMLMQAHLQFQLYELYRARGGEVIPLTSAE